MIYLFVIVILLIGVIRYENLPENSRSRNNWYLIEWLTLVLLAGLRYRVGGDTLAYYDEYQNWPTLSELHNFDFSTARYNVLWILFESTCRTVSKDFVFLQMMHAIIFNGVLFYFLKTHTKYIFTTIFLYAILYFFRYNTETIRASLAVAMFLISYDFLINKKWGKYTLCSIIAIGFHSEAIAMLAFPVIHLLKQLKVSTPTVIGIIVFSIGAMSFNFLPFFSGLLSNSQRVSENYQLYADASTFGSGVSALGYIKTFVFEFLWIILYIGLTENRYLYVRAFIVLFYFSSFQHLNYSNVFYRMQDFLIPIMLIALSEYLKILKTNNNIQKKIIFYSLFSTLFIGFILNLIDGHWVLFYPYYSVFDPETSNLREMFFYGIFDR